MNIVFISPHFPPRWRLFVRALAERGHSVLGIGDAPPDSIGEALREDLAEYLYVPDMQDRDTMVRALGLLTYHYGRLHRIDSLNEHWLGVEAMLRGDFAMPGLRPEEALECRSKVGMRARFERAGIPHAQGRAVPHPGALAEAAAALTMPLIAKPATGVGAGGIFEMGSEDEVAAVAERIQGPYVVEEKLTGRLMSYDGLVDEGGHTVFEHCTVVNKPIFEIAKELREVHFYSLREPPAGLVELGRRCVEAFPLRGRFFHIEAFELPDGSFRALEVNMRPPGGVSVDMMNYSFDFDAYGLWAEAVTGADLSGRSFERKYHCAHVGRRAALEYAHDGDAVQRRWREQVVLREPLPAPFNRMMGDEVWLVRSPELEELLTIIAELEALAGGSHG